MKEFFSVILSVLFFGVAVMAIHSKGWCAGHVDHSLYAGLLKKHVVDGVVSYSGLKAEEATLDEYLKALERTEPESLSKNERFAFYINAYNAWTIKLILGAYPGVKSIKDLGGWFKSPWQEKICRINGEIISLDHIEHQILRPQFKDPRVHFAINCASKGCPALRSEPYDGAALEHQLDDSARHFINNPAYNRLDGKTWYVSRIFDWFSEDFNNDIVGFISRNANEDLRQKIQVDSGQITVKYLDYDWSLNGR
jgi:hypothetical protein